MISDLLAEAHRLGFLGPGSLDGHIEVGRALARTAAELCPAGGSIIDLGSGGGIPGLFIAELRPDVRLVLVERMARRASFLRSAVGRTGWTQVEVMEMDIDRWAERASVDVVTARGFAAPAVTAEVASSLLSGGGYLVVSDVIDRERWPVRGLADVGFGPRSRRQEGSVTVGVTQRGTSPAIPRRSVAQMRKRPVWSD